MLQRAIEAMKSAEEAMSKSNRLVIDLFREFLDYTKEQDQIEEVETPKLLPPPERSTANLTLEELKEEVVKMIAEYGSAAEASRATGGVAPHWTLNRYGQGKIPRKKGIDSIREAVQKWWEIAGQQAPKRKPAPIKGPPLRLGPLSEDEVVKKTKEMVEYFGGYKQTAREVGSKTVPIQTNTSLVRRVCKSGQLPNEKGPRGKEAILKLYTMLDGWRALLQSTQSSSAPTAPPPAKPLVIACPLCGTEMEKRGTAVKCPKHLRISLPLSVLQGGAAAAHAISSLQAAIDQGAFAPAIDEGKIVSEIIKKTADNPSIEYPLSSFGIKKTDKSIMSLLKKQPEIDQDTLKKDNEIKRKTDVVYTCPIRHKFFKIAYATTEEGQQPARRETVKWNRQTKNAFMKLFETICNDPDGKIQKGDKFKRLKGDIWEFKSNRYKKRITCFTYRPPVRKGKGGDLTLYLATAFPKKENELPTDKEVNYAIRVMDSHIARAESKGRRNPHHSSWQDHYDRIIGLEYDGAEDWLTPEEVDQIAQRAEDMAQLEREEAERDFHDEYLEQQFRGWKLPWYATEPPPGD